MSSLIASSLQKGQETVRVVALGVASQPWAVMLSIEEGRSVVFLLLFITRIHELLIHSAKERL